jgi:hypothetical protein
MYSIRASLQNAAFYQLRQFGTGQIFKILGVQQIAIGGLSKAKLASFWVEALGRRKILIVILLPLIARCS